jgi:hypothetical protein
MKPNHSKLPDWKIVAVALALLITAAAVCGILAVPAHGDDSSLWRWFDLDRELNFTTFFSAGLLLINAWLVLLLIRGNQVGRVAFGLVAIFTLMGFDEVLKFHETLEKTTGIDWQILYSPIILVAGLAWAYIWLNIAGLTRILWTGGAFAWGSSQVLEAAQWGWFASNSEKADGYNLSMITEELLEMIGSGLFLLALLRLLAQPNASQNPASP